MRIFVAWQVFISIFHFVNRNVPIVIFILVQALSITEMK